MFFISYLFIYCLLMLQNVREQLEESLPGTGGGRNPNDDLLVKFLFLLPPFALLFCYYQSFLQVSAYMFYHHHYLLSSIQQNDYFYFDLMLYYVYTDTGVLWFIL